MVRVRVGLGLSLGVGLGAILLIASCRCMIPRDWGPVAGAPYTTFLLLCVPIAN